ncbi:SE1832 family protein [Staphylococcus pettenkoferi]|uniref:SE1832 family protein n=1 Tax=Staphylococcus pettenkoferi TaxID=170573 RepID=UPI000AB21781|nr:SE1832 family protein [Staphylococcus pettenkoferi]MDK7115070.1 SE1832 family protein [Staphylococcus pettenkoferi]MDK7283023.1 SE1832 family protein [Staphylococcus pettenkoferi]
MDLNSQLEELKYDYIRLQNDLDKRESVGLETDPLIKQLEDIEQQISDVRAKMREEQ